MQYYQLAVLDSDRRSLAPEETTLYSPYSQKSASKILYKSTAFKPSGHQQLQAKTTTPKKHQKT